MLNRIVSQGHPRPAFNLGPKVLSRLANGFLTTQKKAMVVEQVPSSEIKQAAKTELVKGPSIFGRKVQIKTQE